MMYYNTPDLKAFQLFLFKYRWGIILFYALFTLTMLALYRPQFVSTDELFWLKESKTMQATLEKKYHTNYLSRLSITVDNFDEATLDRIQTMLEKIKAYDGVKHVESLFSKKHIIKVGDESSNMIRTLDLSALSVKEIKELLDDLPARFTSLVEPKQVKLHFYIYADHAINLNKEDIEFTYSYSQPNTNASFQDYLVYLFAIIFSIIIFFRLLFKNYFSAFIALTIISISFIATMVLSFFVTGMTQLHIAMPLIIIAISLVDYLYFYYRWHVSQYKADLDRAMLKTLNRNLFPAFWTSFITIIGLGGLLFIDSAIVKALSLSIIGASTFTYVLNITLFPALASFFEVRHPKVGFGRFCYFFANQEMHYNSKSLVLFLLATLILSAVGGYQLLFGNERIFSNNQRSGIITASVAPFEITQKSIQSYSEFEETLQRRFDPSIKMSTLTSLVKAIHHANYPKIALNDDHIMEALMYMDMYNFSDIKNSDGSYIVTFTFDTHKVNKGTLLNFLEQQKEITLFFTDIDSLTSSAKEETSLTLAFSLASAMILIGLIMSRIFWSRHMALIGFVVNATPIVWLGFLIQLFHLPFTFEVLVAMSIALGLGSDATVHFAYKYSRSRYFGRTQKHSLEIMFFYGGIPVIIGSIILILAFLLLTLTSVYTLQLIGLYGAALMFLSLMTDLFILPVFLLAYDKYDKA